MVERNDIQSTSSDPAILYDWVFIEGSHPDLLLLNTAL